MNKVSVILTSYNRDTLLAGAIESVLGQTHQDFELFIMDDDSDNPQTHAVLDRYEGRPRVQIYRHKLNGVERFSRTGYAENINRALELATGNFITYLTCDDVYLPDRLARMVKHFQENPEHMVVYGVQQLVWLKPDGAMVERGLRDEGSVVKAAACLIDHNSVMHRRQCVEICGKPLWPTDPAAIGMADAVVWQKFNAHWPFHRVAGGPTDEHRFHKDSIQGR